MTRINLLEETYPCQRGKIGKDGLEMYEHLCHTNLNGIYKAPTYLNGFSKLFEDISKTDLYEGLVLKRLIQSYLMAFKCLTTTIGRLNAENQQKYIIFKTKTTIMAKYELVEKTETNGEVWYSIRKDDKYVDNSYTRNIEDAIQMLDKFIKGKPTEPIFKIIKTIEVK